jgi:hypothetical protein
MSTMPHDPRLMYFMVFDRTGTVKGMFVTMPDAYTFRRALGMFEHGVCRMATQGLTAGRNGVGIVPDHVLSREFPNAALAAV